MFKTEWIKSKLSTIGCHELENILANEVYNDVITIDPTNALIKMKNAYTIPRDKSISLTILRIMNKSSFLVLIDKSELSELFGRVFRTWSFKH